MVLLNCLCSFPENGEFMILKYKYHCDSGLLEAYRSYTLAQNNSLSDTIIITSTATDAERYSYCLEFICYNSKSIPKAQYISPILAYSDGISFVIPNDLTQFRGHVDMQLTGYDPDDNSIVFKSIAKNCKAFDVEGSLGVLEKDLNETPNVFTEVMKQLAELKKVRQDIIDEALRSFSQQMLEAISAYKWCNVRFVDRGELIEEKHYIQGSKIVAPQYVLPEGCVLVEGWYSPDKEGIWDFEDDKVQDDMTLYLNYMSEGMVIENGKITNKGNYNNVYCPEYYGGHKVAAIDNISVGRSAVFYLGNNMDDISYLLAKEGVEGIYMPSDNKAIISRKGALYINDGDVISLAYVPHIKDEYFAMMEGCEALYYSVISKKCNLKRLVLAQSLRYVAEYAISDTDLKTLTLPRFIETVEDHAVFNNKNLTEIYLEGDASEGLTDMSFVCLDYQGNVTYRPTLYVKAQYYDKYKQRGLAYDIKVWGEEYFDGKYVAKGA